MQVVKGQQTYRIHRKQRNKEGKMEETQLINKRYNSKIRGTEEKDIKHQQKMFQEYY